jgi:D-alanine transaminase
MRTVYVNGDYVPEDQARVSVFDRGFLMADGVYEVTSVLDGKLIDFDGHVRRLDRSLRELDMQPVDGAALLAMHRELVDRNAIDQGMIYLQVTRGNPGDRSFVMPGADCPPTVVAFTQAIPNLADAPAARTGFRVITIPDLRWGRVDIKTVQLLYPSMGKMAAKKAGCDDSWFVADDGSVTEGTSNNAYIVKGNRIITRQLGQDILHGITRAAVLRFAAEAQFEIEERPFTVAEAQGADEAFATAASIFVMPVVEIDGARIGDGVPGRVATRLREIYLDEMRKAAI